MSKDKMILFEMGEFKVSGIVCSANAKPGWTLP